MENNQESKSSRMQQFLQEKGYYIVLFLCICAVGVAGYVFLSEAISEQEAEKTPAMSVVTTVEEKTPDAASEEVQAVAKASANVQAEKKAAAVRVWPVSGAVQTEYCADVLCFNSTTQDWRTHEALDLTAQLGEQVRAAAAGTVTAVYDDASYGTTVTISHDGGYTTTYANLAQMPEVAAGAEVEAGAIIGTVGDTALLECSQTPHLHFAVSYAGMSMDPRAFLETE